MSETECHEDGFRAARRDLLFAGEELRRGLCSDIGWGARWYV